MQSGDVKARIKSSWDAIADEFENKIGNEGDVFRQYMVDPMIFDLLHESKGMSLLDVGCGNGYLLPKLREKGFLADGLDISSNQLRYASKRVADGSLFEADIEDIGTLPAKKYDSIICSFFLDGIQNLDLAIEGCFHLLRQGGSLVINIPHPCFIGYDFWKKGKHVAYVAEDADGQEIYLYKCTKTVLFFQRPLFCYINAIAKAGFAIKKICEPEPSALHQYILDTGRKPKPAYVLGILARKP